MIDVIVNFLTNNISKELAVGIIALFPIIELRGAIPIGKALGLPLMKSIGISFIGSSIPAFFIIYLIGYMFKLLRKINFFDKLINKFNDRALKNKHKIEKYGYWGLFLFVGIPLPGTGVWTGSLLAHLLNLDKKKSLLTVILGNALAGLIISILTGAIFTIIK